jgi:hypothetical protein
MIAEALSGYFTDFGEVVTWTGGSFTAIFDVPVNEANQVLSTTPILTAPSVDIGALAAGDSVSVRGTTYTVRTVEPDGTGLTIITITTP